MLPAPAISMTITAGHRAPGTCGLLPAEVRERTVRLGHTMHILALLHRASLAVRGGDQLACQLLLHALLAPIGRILDDPADAERHAAIGTHFHRNLIGGAAHATRANLD